MGVGIEGGPHPGMAQPLLDDLGVGALLEHQRCVGMAGNAMNTLPSGYQIVENQRTGLPLLKKT